MIISTSCTFRHLIGVPVQLEWGNRKFDGRLEAGAARIASGSDGPLQRINVLCMAVPGHTGNVSDRKWPMEEVGRICGLSGEVGQGSRLAKTFDIGRSRF